MILFVRQFLTLALVGGLAWQTGATTAKMASIWPSTAVPATLLVTNDKTAVELGVKFRSATEGSIAGICFFKGPANSGPHLGHLWASNGTLLASVSFSHETDSGWQYQPLPDPVPISSNTTYIVSYYAPMGWYSADVGYFAKAGVDSYPLRALSNDEGSGNGVFVYGAGAFPTNTYGSVNYWVDVVFVESGGTEAIPPMVCAASPEPGSDGVHVNQPVTVSFDEAMATSSITTNTISLYDSLSNLVAATLSFNQSNSTATLTPTSLLKSGMTYGVRVKGGTGGVADVAGNNLSQDYAWSFSTLPGAPYGGGPGGPILILASTSNPFGQYYAEILLAEGLNEFALADISTVSSATLAQYDLVLLGQMALSPAQVMMLSNWVNAGGNLIAMRPDKQLAGLLGLADSGASLAEGYLLVNSAWEPGAGIVGQTMQFHGTADLYSLESAASLATLCADSQNATASPAVTLRSVGTNGGQAAAFTYDLARSVVLMHQGNPAWAGQDRDGVAPVRSDDLFFGAAGFDPRPDWVDADKLAIPQADEQQRLLANLVASMNASKRLLPRFWYFPDGYRAVVVMSGDDHARGGTAGRFDHYLALSPTNASVADWQAIRSSSYIYPNAAMSSGQAAAYTAAGFEIGLHLNSGCTNWTRGTLTAFFAQQLNEFAATYPGLPLQVSHRMHCVAWSDYSTLMEVGRQFGIRLDLSQYYYPPGWVSNRPGFFTGSSMPMRFATAEGNVIDAYEAATVMTDESGQSYPYTSDVLLDRALGPEGYYGALVAEMHTDLVDSPGSEAILGSARSRGVPVISARQLLDWLDGRNSSRFQAISWSNNRLSFSVQAGAGARGLRAMVPVPAGYALSGLKHNGAALDYSLRGVKGMQYAMFAALSGDYEASFEPDTTPPRVTGIVPASGTLEVSTTNIVVINFSEAIAQSSISTNTISLYDPLSKPVAAQLVYNPFTLSVVLTPKSPLAFATTYTVRLKGGAQGVRDVAGNGLGSDFSGSFTTRVVHSLWDDWATPTLVSWADTNEVEVGMKFLSREAGYVTGLRFYKGPGNSGPHVGSLWNPNGMLLARVSFSDETASGWQYQGLASPLAIRSNQIYVVSYHAPNGNYSVSEGYFLGAGVDRHPLHALASGESGGNGVFSYGPSAFPAEAFNGANYWVDVVVAFPSELPLIDSITVSNSIVTISWDSVPGRTYRVEYKESLQSPTWASLIPSLTATGAVTRATDSNAVSPQRFYRVWVVP